MSRADKYTATYKKPAYYSDFLTSFDVNPLTGLLATVMNEDSVNQSIRNLVLTNKYERYEQPLLGSKIQALLFEPFTPIVQQQLQSQISETISNYEPRATVVEVVVAPMEDQNALSCSVVYSLINIPQQIHLSLILTRVR
jgi:phage baseplate assembly protein W